jgi:hypothetical protein
MGTGASGCNGARVADNRPRPEIPRYQFTKHVNFETLIPILGKEGIPRPRHYLSYDLTEKTLVKALECMAEDLRKKHSVKDLTIIAIGGAVNTILLKDRPTTHGVDFMETDDDSNHRMWLDEAALEVQRQETFSRTPLGWFWFNNHVRLLMDHDVYKRVVLEAKAQDEVIFHKKGLKIIAAPWDFAFCMKANRLTHGKKIPGEVGEAPAYDVSDAVAYLRRYIEAQGGHPVSMTKIRRWQQLYRKHIGDDVTLKITREYKQRYRTPGIILRSRSEGLIVGLKKQ